ncbi:MAG: hypothetical protein KC464_35530, partial [Myxococcales bacterium]|nr:hypothetical protein [Myxococcales bacterium]
MTSTKKKGATAPSKPRAAGKKPASAKAGPPAQVELDLPRPAGGRAKAEATVTAKKAVKVVKPEKATKAASTAAAAKAAAPR